MSEIKIRFNTKYLDTENHRLTWRVLENGTEYLAAEVQIFVPSFTTKDFVEGNVEKWHLTCVGNLSWDGDRAVIK